jgi:methyl-accepting chemotaxis protein
MNRLSLKMKLGVAFGSMLAILVAMGFVAYDSVGRLADISHRADDIMTKKDLSSQIEAAIEKQTTGVRGFLLSGREDTLQHDEEGKQEFADGMEKLPRLLVLKEGKKLYVETRRSYDEYRSILDQEIQLRRADKEKQAEELAFNAHTSETRTRLRRAVAGLVSLQDRLKEDVLREQSAMESHVRFIVVFLALAGIAIGLGIAVLITRSIGTSISLMVNLIQEIARNNLAVEDLQVASEDETGRAAEALNQMKNSLREIIQSIAGTAAHVASASEEISTSATQQAQGAETQRDQATQVATAMQEMSSTVAQVSDNCNSAAEAARQAAETARQGGAIVEETLGKMQVIAESVGATATNMGSLDTSSERIGRIIGVIDEIADQTNLLALNAAIEAARAGEQGRGFAVVADEVRKLAERTTMATKEIAQMIQNIQGETKAAVTGMKAATEQVVEGVSSTAKAGESLKGIIRMSEQVGEMITQIATAATQQSSTTEHVNSNLEQIARLVKESAIGAQQSAQACQDLSGLALDLQTMVGKFQLGENQQAASGQGRGRLANPKPSSSRAQAAGAH